MSEPCVAGAGAGPGRACRILAFSVDQRQIQTKKEDEKGYKQNGRSKYQSSLGLVFMLLGVNAGAIGVVPIYQAG